MKEWHAFALFVVACVAARGIFGTGFIESTVFLAIGAIFIALIDAIEARRP